MGWSSGLDFLVDFVLIQIFMAGQKESRKCEGNVNSKGVKLL